MSIFRAWRLQAQPGSVKRSLTADRKTHAMEAPSQFKPALWGAIGGAVALAIVGFTWGGWVTGGKADVLARLQVQAALVEVLTPICIDKFNKATDAQAKLVELKKITSSWDRERYVRENDWAKFGKESNSRVVDACAAELYKL
jgi:hypothetical protein